MSRTFTSGEACDIAGVSPIQIEIWCRAGLLRPQQSGRGRGNHRRFEDDDLTRIIIIRELTHAGLSVPQVQQVLAVLRARLVKTPPAWRSAKLFAAYIRTVQTLANTFGKADIYDRWLTEATACLIRMREAARVHGRRSERADDIDGACIRELLAAVSRLPNNGLTVRQCHDVSAREGKEQATA